MTDEPAFLPVGTEISAKFKGAFCEAKVKKIVHRNVKCKVSFKDVQGGSALLDESSIKGTIRIGALVDVVHPDTKQTVSAVIQSVKDGSTYTVVFDDGDERTLRRTQMCLKGGKHFHASESLDVNPLTKPEQFGAPVLGRRKKGGRPRKQQQQSPIAAAAAAASSVDTTSDTSSSSDDDETLIGSTTTGGRTGDLDEGASGAESEPKPTTIGAGGGRSGAYGGHSSDYGRVVCVYDQGVDTRRWFPALVVCPKMKKGLKINSNSEYYVRSFKDGRCLVVQKSRVQEFNLSKGKKVDLPTIKLAVEKAILYLEKDELPPHWDRELLLGERTAADDDDAESTTDRQSSPGSKESSPDRSPISSALTDDRSPAPRGGKDQEETSIASEKQRGERSDSDDEEGDDAEEDDDGDEAEKSDDSSAADRRSPEVGGTSSSAKEKSTAMKPNRKVKRARHTSSITQRSLSISKRSTTATASSSPSTTTSPRGKRGGPAAAAAAALSEKKDRFVAQLYKFMDERGTPINKAPVLAGKELDLYAFFDAVKKQGGYNRVCHRAEWPVVIRRMKLSGVTTAAVKNAFCKHLFSFESFYKKLGSALNDVNMPSGAGRVSRRERHASKSGMRPALTKESTPDSSRRRSSTTSKTPKEERSTVAKSQKSTTIPPSSTAPKPPTIPDNIDPPPAKVVATTALAAASPRPSNNSREPSKERSTSPSSSSIATILPPHPPINDDELVVGARVKVHYGSGSHRKLYQAKIVKYESDTNRYLVHYLGWNTRYDEAVPKSRIVEVLAAITAASSDSGVSNNDQGENGGGNNNNNGGRTPGRNRSQPGGNGGNNNAEKSPFWRRRRSSGGSTHSLPITTTQSATNDESQSMTSTRKTSSISNAAATTAHWKKRSEASANVDALTTTAANPAAASEATEKESSTKEDDQNQSNIATPPAISDIPTSPGKRSASSNANPSTPTSTTVVESGMTPRDRGSPESTTPSRRGRRPATQSLSSSAIKRKRSLEESDDDEENASNKSSNSRRVSKRLRGVKASIEEMLKDEEEESGNEGEKLQPSEDAGGSSTVPKTISTTTTTMTIVEQTETDDGMVTTTTVTETTTINNSSMESVAEAMEISAIESVVAAAMVAASASSPVASSPGMDKEPETKMAEEKSIDAETSNRPDTIEEEEDGEETKLDAPNDESSTSTAVVPKEKEKDNNGEKLKETPTSAQRQRPTKMRRRRRNYSQMVTDHRKVTKSKKDVVDSDNELGKGGHDACSPRDPHSLHALRQRIQSEMDNEPEKHRSRFSFNVVDESLPAEQKVQVVQSQMTELKDVYLKIRAELSGYEKCRKQLNERKRKQEKHALKASKRAAALAADGATKKHGHGEQQQLQKESEPSKADPPADSESK